MPIAGCPSREQLSAYLLGSVPEQQADRIARHLEECTSCSSLVEVLGGSSDSRSGQSSRAVRPGEDVTCDSHAEDAGLPAMSAADAATLGQLGDYKLLEELGHGGMGTVYKALHVKLGRIVALKVLPKQRIVDNQAVARFQREMMAVGALDHPNIVRATDASEADGTHFLVMEYVEGCDLSELVDRCGPLPVADACELVRQAAMGLDCASRHGLVHRDIKPSNLMLTAPSSSSPSQEEDPGGVVKVLDLGLARFRFDQPSSAEVTATGQTMGTADYIAPEQVSDSHSVDVRADIYSLGCTLYKLLAGRPPFHGAKYKSAFDKMTAHVQEPVPPIRQIRKEVPKPLATVLQRMLAKEPADRFETPAQVADALEPFATGCNLGKLLQRAGRDGGSGKDAVEYVATDNFVSSPMTGTQPSEPTHRPVARPARRGRRLAAIALGVVLLAVGGPWLYGVIVRITKDGKETVVRVPDGADVNIRPDGEVDVKLPSEKTPAASEKPSAPGRKTPVVEPPPTQPVPPSPGTVPVAKDPLSPKQPTAVARIEADLPPAALPPPDTTGSEISIMPKPPVAADPQTLQPKTVLELIPPEPLQMPPGKRLSRAALVARPKSIPGVRSWTIETRAHRGAVRAVRYRPGAQVIATAGGDGAIRLWDAGTGKLRRMLLGHDGPVNALAWSHDGSALASGGNDRTVRLWDVESGRMLRTLRGHLGRVHAVVFSPDGRTLASAGSDKSIRLWDVATAKIRQVLRGHEGEVYGITFSRDGHLLASGSSDENVIVWDAASGQVLSTFEGHKGPIRDVAFSPDGKLVTAAAGIPELLGAVQFWNLASGKAVNRLPGHRHGDSCLAYSPDGQLLAVGGAGLDAEVRVWDAAAGDLLSTLRKPSGTSPAWSVDFSPDGQWLAVGGSRGVVQSWESISGRPGQTLPAHAATARCVAFSPDEAKLACGYQDGTVRLWEVRAGKPVLQIKPELEAVEHVAWSPTGKVLAVAYHGSNLVDLWDADSGKRAHRVSGDGPVRQFAFSPDGKSIALVGDMVQVFSTGGDDAPTDLRTHAGSVTFSLDGVTLAVAVGGDVRLYGASSGKPLRASVLRSASPLRTMAFSSGGRFLAAASDDHKVNVWDVKLTRPAPPKVLDTHQATAVSLCWLEDGTTLICGTPDEVLTWETQSDKVLTIEVDGGAISPTAGLIASRGASTIRLHGLADGQLVRTIVALSDGSHLSLTPTLETWTASPGLEQELLYVVLTDTGQETLSAKEFAGKYGWIKGRQ